MRGLFTSLWWGLATLATVQGRLHGGDLTLSSSTSSVVENSREGQLVTKRTLQLKDKMPRATKPEAIAVASQKLAFADPPSNVVDEEPQADWKRTVLQQEQARRRLWDKKADVTLLIDGSASVSSSQFDIQKQALEDAVQDEAAIPRDGSVAVLLILIGGDEPEVIVDYTLVNSDDDIDDIVDDIDRR